MKKILVIDDDEEIVALTTMCLKTANYKVFTAYSGKEGLQKAKKYQPDLIVLDLLIPGMHGFDVCQQLRADNDELKILVVSGKPHAVDQRVVLRLGAAKYLLKPWKQQQLLDVVHELLVPDYGNC